MITPDIEFQTAIRGELITNQLVTDLVPADHIRAGSTRPDKFPCVILANPQVNHLGRTSGGAYLSRVFIDLHIWALEDGADVARHIGNAAAVALWDAPGSSVIGIDEYTRPSFTYMRDPDPERAFCHGVGSVEGVIRWRV